MKKVLLIVFLICYTFTLFSQDFNKPPKYIYFAYDDTIKNACNDDSLFYNLIKTLEFDGEILYLDKKDDWLSGKGGHTLLFNDGYRTKVLNNIICEKYIYYTDLKCKIFDFEGKLLEYDSNSTYLKIKEFIFPTNKLADSAYNIFTKTEFISNYIGPREWYWLKYKNLLILLEGGNIFFWSNYAPKVMNLTKEFLILQKDIKKSKDEVKFEEIK